MAGALDGVRVLEVGGSQSLYAGKLLADQGAEVVLVEPLDGHPCRRLPPYGHGPLDDNSSVVHAYFNGGKHSVTLPLGTPEGADALRSLVERTDVVLAAGRPSQLRALGVDPPEILRTAPGVVVVTVTPFGWTGPRAEWHGDDLIAQATGGLMTMGGYVDGRPLRPPARQAYHAASLFASVAVLAALVAREDSRAGQHLDVSVQESVTMALENLAQYYDMEGTIRSRFGGRQLQVGRGIYACADGYVYLMLGLHAGSKFWPRFVDWMRGDDEDAARQLEGPEWGEREFIESEGAKQIFNRVFGAFCATRSRSQLYREAMDRALPLAPVNDLSAVMADEQLLARGFFRRVPTSEWSHGPAVAPGAPYRMTVTPWHGRFSPPAIGESNARLAIDGRGWTPGTAGAGWPARRRATGKLDADQRQAGQRQAGQRPLHGIRVVDFCWVGAGAYTTRMLADLGAEVIKIESRTRVDQIRLTAPFRDRVPGVNRSGYFADRNAGKRGITLNVKHPEARGIVLDLAARSHLMTNNFAPGTLARLGLGYDVVRERRPDIIYAEMSMLGAAGPHSGHIGYGMTIGAMSGLQHLVGEPGRPPSGTGTNYPDHIPSPGHGLFAILAALYHWRTTGVGQYIELSQAEATVAVLGDLVMAESMGHHQEPADNVEPSAILHDAFAVRDGQWVALSVYEPAQWDSLRGVLALPDVVDWPWALRVGAAHPDDAAGRAERARLRTWIEQQTARWAGPDLVEALQAAGVTAGLVNDAREVVERDPQLRARDHWVRLPHAEIVDCLYNAIPIRSSTVDLRPAFGAPLLGEHTREVLAELGLSEEQISALDSDGALS